MNKAKKKEGKKPSLPSWSLRSSRREMTINNKQNKQVKYMVLESDEYHGDK